VYVRGQHTPATEDYYVWSENNLIAGNTNGGLYLYNANWHGPNDTIADNGTYGVMMTGTYTTTTFTAWLSNTILWGHTWSFTVTQVPTYTNFFTMVAGYSDVQGGWPGAGNLNVAPLFVGGGDYHLQSSSPVIDKGNNAFAPAVDLDGVPRPVPAGGVVDMGCYEWRLPGVDLWPDRSATPRPGTQVTFQHTISNTGNGGDIFNLSATSAQGWSVQVTPQVALPAGGGTTVFVAVMVPAGLPAGITDTIRVVATSAANPLVVDAVRDDITVALAPALTLAPDRTGGALVGSKVVYEHTLTNLGNGTDTLQLSVVSSQGWGVTVVPPAVTLAAGVSTTVQVWVSIPANAAPGAIDVATAKATSATDGTVFQTVADTTTAYGWPYHTFLPLVTKNP
jgi:hypothetical protein